jgi:antitoxin component YwqK of YwqJK toxin-antitoxin module
MKYMRLAIFALSLLYSCLSFAQIEATIHGFNQYVYAGTDTARFYKVGSTGVTYLVCDNNRVYKQYHNDKLTLHGELDKRRGRHGGFMKTGKWTEYYDNGKIKCIGAYYKDIPVDKWMKYYENGKLQAEYSYAYVDVKEGARNNLSGLYRGYYDNGNLKTEGLYKQAVDPNFRDTIFVENPVTGEMIMRIRKVLEPVSVKFGVWRHYSKEGRLEKEEEFE